MKVVVLFPNPASEILWLLIISWTLLFDFSSRDDFIQAATKQIIEGAEKYFPMVTIDDIVILDLDRSEKFEANQRSLAKVKLRVIFSLKGANINNLAVDVLLRTGG